MPRRLRLLAMTGVVTGEIATPVFALARNDMRVTKCTARTIPSTIKMRNDTHRTVHALKNAVPPPSQ